MTKDQRRYYTIAIFAIIALLCGGNDASASTGGIHCTTVFKESFIREPANFSGDVEVFGRKGKRLIQTRQNGGWQFGRSVSEYRAFWDNHRVTNNGKRTILVCFYWEDTNA